MAKKNWDNKFKEYMERIVSHPNYSGLTIKRNKNGDLKWLATKKTKVGAERIKWIEEKAKEMNIDTTKPYFSKVMIEVHPWKSKVCQICGQSMSLRYIYPNKNFVKKLVKKYGYVPDDFDNIEDINQHFKNIGLDEEDIKKLYKKEMSLQFDIDTIDLDEMINRIEEMCRKGEKKTFGPGAMSNFPDRFDGYHSYNRCCRKEEDTGRHDENMKSYTKDRRAYEYWSEGNIHAANKFMKSSYFKDLSADHIGPISLGFKHDPLFLQPMLTGQNSAKRDRLTKEDIEQIIEIENRENTLGISWFSELIWEDIKDNYNIEPHRIEEWRIQLKKNMNCFMSILWEIIHIEEGKGKVFLEECYLRPKNDFFKYDYKFDENGNIRTKVERNITDSTRKEYQRLVKISFDSIEEYNDKENRIISVNTFPQKVVERMEELAESIKKEESFNISKRLLKEVMVCIQKEIIAGNI